MRVALFQFHEGPIKTTSYASLCHGYMSFNSMKVRLKLRFRFINFGLISLFQIHEGPIKTMPAAS